MNQKERLELIRQNHEKEQRKRKIFIHRIIFALAALVVVIILIFAVKFCVSSISDRIEQKKQEEAALLVTPSPMPVPTEVVIENPYEISQAFFVDSAFIGNSFIDGMFIYGLVDGADYFAKVGLNVNAALTEPTETGTVPVIDELGGEKQYNRIFMMFGENELGWRSTDTFVKQYGELIDKAKTYQPQSKIYLLAITPITKKVSDENIDNTTNEQIAIYNGLIKQLAQDKGVSYADIHAAVADETGVLPEDAASDGIHFGAEYYKKCLLYIQNNYK